MGGVVGGGSFPIQVHIYFSCMGEPICPPFLPYYVCTNAPPKKSSPRFISQSYFSFFHFPVAPVFFFFGFAASHTVTHTHLGSSNVKVLNGVL